MKIFGQLLCWMGGELCDLGAAAQSSPELSCSCVFGPLDPIAEVTTVWAVAQTFRHRERV